MKPFLAASSVIFPTLAILASGCGQIGGSHFLPTLNTPQYQGSASASTITPGVQSGNGNYSCTMTTNVQPDSNWYSLSQGYYYACPSNQSGDNADVLVKNDLPNSATICAYPVQYVDSQHVYVKPDATTGLPWVECVAAQAGMTYFSFASVNYNALIVVTPDNKLQMTDCIITAGFELNQAGVSCPNFSYGQFR